MSIEGVNQELGAYHGIPAHELSSKSFHVDSARRTAACDLREATAKLELAKLRGGQPSASSKQRESDLGGELEEIAALRKLGTIFESIARAADELGAVACQAKPYSDRLAEMNAQAETMKARLADCRARDVREELEGYEPLVDELRWTRGLLDEGKWRTRGGDAREAIFNEELSTLLNLGRYTGEMTMDGAERQVLLLEQRIATMDARRENELTPTEMAELPQLVREIAALDAAILEEARYSYFAIASARFHEARFGQLLEAASISAESVVKSYEITRELIALQVA